MAVLLSDRKGLRTGAIPLDDGCQATSMTEWKRGCIKGLSMPNLYAQPYLDTDANADPYTCMGPRSTGRTLYAKCCTLRRHSDPRSRTNQDANKDPTITPRTQPRTQNLLLLTQSPNHKRERQISLIEFLEKLIILIHSVSLVTCMLSFFFGLFLLVLSSYTHTHSLSTLLPLPSP